MKKISAFLLAFTLLLSIFAATPSSSSASGNEQMGVIDLKTIDKLEKEGKATIRELSYEETLERIASNEKISIDQAKKVNSTMNNTQSRSLAAAASTTLHEIKIRQSVKSTYKPAVQLFVWMSGSGSFWQFDKMYDYDIDRKHITGSTSKQFAGKLKAEIQSKSKIFYYINGDFYNNGTTTISGTVTAGGKIWSGSASASTTSSHYAYWNNSGYTYTN
ncbi:hypothetical protein H7T43_24060 [Peribacillus simplex]|uniref:hypothetical protein n=1 Tax=Peribacillus simplex TaxID=1478 RepID=UPI002989A329|nr:hypothetical protein [Peribacillus simplex]MBX9957937.1 hypothetical protein [Peribacillus simplex]